MQQILLHPGSATPKKRLFHNAEHNLNGRESIASPHVLIRSGPGFATPA